MRDASDGFAALSNDDHIELTRLVIDIAFRIDRGLASTVFELFTEDGEMAVGVQSMKGRDEFAAWAQARGAVDRLTRHVCTNMRFVATGADTAEGTTLLTVYLHDGPGQPIALPHTVGEYHDTFVRVNDRWWFRSRQTDSIFSRA
jgi:hypothetical protein